MDKKLKREKPIYNMWQNSAYVIKNVWKRDRILLFIILAQIVLTVSISTLGIFLPKLVVEQIMSESSIKVLIFTIFIFTAANIIQGSALGYCNMISNPKESWLRILIDGDTLSKIINTDFANLFKIRFIDLKEKVWDISTAFEKPTQLIYGTFSKLGINLLGFIVYLFLIISVNPFILIIAIVSAVIGAVTRVKEDKWKYDHDDEYISYAKPLWYINNIGSKFDMAKDIRLFAMTNWINNIYNANLKLMHDFRRKERLKQLFADIIACIASFLQMGISYGYLLWAVLYGGLSVDNFVLLFAAINGFSGWIVGILNEFTLLSRYSLSFCRVREFLDYPNSFKYDNGEHIEYTNGKKYDLELKNVSFCYEGADDYTFKNINLKISGGEKLAIVGLNGAGKTTLVKIICGLHDPTEGQVLLNNKDIRDFNRKDYYKLFTAVYQDFNILPMTIAENISQHTDKEIDYDRVWHCIELADLTEKIKSLPNGLNTLLIKEVNEEAAELSGGETQKLMLARALYKNSPVLILDEPTAALDPIAESKLYGKYNELSESKTSLYISHRLASTRFCDRIILIDENTIKEQGSHDELIKLGGKYAELFEIQSKYYKEGKTL